LALALAGWAALAWRARHVAKRARARRARLRKVAHGDYDAIVELTRSVYGGNDYVADRMADWIQAGRFWALVDPVTDVPLALVNILGQSEFGVGLIEGLRTHPDFTGLGLAVRLTRAACEQEADTLNSFVYTTLADNPASAKVALRAGFVLHRALPLLVVTSPRFTEFPFKSSVSGTPQEWMARMERILPAAGAPTPLASNAAIVAAINRVDPELTMFFFNWHVFSLSEQAIDNELAASKATAVESADAVSVAAFVDMNGPGLTCALTIFTGDPEGRRGVASHMRYWAIRAREQGCQAFLAGVSCPSTTATLDVNLLGGGGRNWLVLVRDM